MLLKVLNGFSQAAIIILALVLITTITTKHSSNVALEDFQKQVEERFQADNKNYDAKIKVVEDSLNRYQQLRENRAILFAERLDKLYQLYQKNPEPIMNSAKIVADTFPPKEENVIDKNLSYFESKANRIDAKVDDLDNRLSSRMSILEQRVEGVQKDKKNNTKVITNNINTVGNITTR